MQQEKLPFFTNWNLEKLSPPFPRSVCKSSRSFLHMSMMWWQLFLSLLLYYAGFNVETVEYKNINFTVWDVGGQDKVFFRFVLGINSNAFFFWIRGVCWSNLCYYYYYYCNYYYYTLIIRNLDSSSMEALLPKHTRTNICRGFQRSRENWGSTRRVR